MKKRNSRKTAVIAMGVVTALTMTACSMIPSAKASYISMDAAQSKALNAANVDAANVESYSAQMGDVELRHAMRFSLFQMAMRITMRSTQRMEKLSKLRKHR